MTKELKDISEKVEELRSKLEKLFNEKGMEDPEVISASRMLDAVLNEYYRLILKKK